MSHRHHRSVSSTTSVAQMSVSSTSSQHEQTTTPSAFNLVYPYPLPLTALLDFGYTVQHYTKYASARYIVLLAIVRLAVLGGMVGSSKRWRNRGGWVTLVCGSTIGAAVWEGCASQLQRARRLSEGAGGRPDISNNGTFLVAVSPNRIE